MYINIKRLLKVKGPLDLVAENANDWSHFAYLHRKSHVLFRPLICSPKQSVFVYKARILHPFPFFFRYLVIREEIPSQLGYRQIYYNHDGQPTSYLSSRCYQQGEYSIVEGNFLFRLPDAFGFLKPLVPLIFKIRMALVANEDQDLIRSRQASQSHSKSASPVPDEMTQTEALYEDFAALEKIQKDTRIDFVVEQESHP